MEWDDMSFSVLNYLNESNWPYKYFDGTFVGIKNHLISTVSEYHSRIKDTQFDNVKYSAELDNELSMLLKQQIKEGVIREYRQGVFDNMRTEVILSFGLTPKGKAHLANIKVNGRVRTVDFVALDYALPYIPWYGDIELMKVKPILKELGIELNIETIERILISYGFCERIVGNAQLCIFYLRLTDKGRKLKELRSLNAFNKFEDSESAKVLALENDRKEATQRNKLQAQLNIYQLGINVSLAISTGVSALYYLLEIRTHHSFFYQQAIPYACTILLSLLFACVVMLPLYRNRQGRK